MPDEPKRHVRYGLVELKPEVLDKLHEAGAPVGGEANWVTAQISKLSARYDAPDPDLAKLIKLTLTSILENHTSPEHQMAAIDRLRDIPALGLKGTKGAPPATERMLSPATQKLLEDM